MLQDYKCTVNAKVSAEEAYRKVARVSDWWTKKSTGQAQEAGDTFKVDWGQTWVAFKVLEAAEIQMTHVGLTPAVECFENCEAGWNFHVGQSLLKLLTEGHGLPDYGKAN